MTVKWYWHRFQVQALHLTLHLSHDWDLRWTRIHGVQVGPWFLGAIKGSAVAPLPEKEPRS